MRAGVVAWFVRRRIKTGQLCIDEVDITSNQQYKNYTLKQFDACHKCSFPFIQFYDMLSTAINSIIINKKIAT